MLTIALLQPIVSPLLSIPCRLITPYIRPFGIKNDGTGMTLARTAFDASCAAMVRSSCTVVPVWCSGNCRNCARASCTSWCGDKRGLCAQQWFGWVTNVFDYRSSGAALCCGLIHQHRWAHPLAMIVTCALCVAEPCAWAGARRAARCNSFEIQTVWSVCTAARTVRRMDARQMHAAVDSGCNGNGQLMCERSIHGLCWLKRKSWHRGDAPSKITPH